MRNVAFCCRKGNHIYSRDQMLSLKYNTDLCR